MPIQLDEPRAPGSPVVKRTAIGQVFNGALVRFEQRGVLKNGEPKMKANGKQQQELVVTVVTMPGTTAPAGIGDDTSVPAPGEVVRLILRGAAFGQWIEARKGRALNVGDVVTQVTEYGQRYDADGNAVGGKLTTQAECDAVPRSSSLGIYGTLSLRAATPADQEWVAKAEAAYHATAQRIGLDAAADEEPF